MPAIRRTTCALLAVFASATIAGAQRPPLRQPVINPAALREDAAILRTALDSLHPGLYRYLTPATLEHHYQRLLTRLDSAHTVADAYLAFSAFLVTVRCGHTFVNPANQGRAVVESVFRNTPRTPFYFRWIDGRMIATRDASASRSFAPATEILAINRVPVSRIRETLIEYSRTDGSNRAKQVANLELRPDERWQAFDIYYPLVFNAPASEWTFTVVTPSGARRLIRATPSTNAERLALYDSLMKSSADSTRPPWSFRVEGTVGILTMNTWATYNSAWDWKRFIDDAFVQLDASGARTLAIDIRGNEGGQDAIGAAILAHLVDTTTIVGQLERFTRYRAIPPALKPYLETWDRSFDDWGTAVSPSPTRSPLLRLIRSADDSAGTIIRAAAPRFRGTVFVLTSPDNSSATFLFSQMVRQLKIGRLVGEPTGGNRRGINGGAYYFLRLPNSRIEADIPLIGYYPVRSQPDAGLVPDIMVRTHPSDFARGRDRALEAVRRAQ